MRLGKKKLICFITSFVMAFTVFGCTGFAFAEEATGDEPSVEPMGTVEAEVTEDETVIDETADSEEDVVPEEDAKVVAMAEITGLNAEGGNKKVDLSWEEVASPDPDHSVYYYVTCKSLEGFSYQTGDLSCTKSGLQPNTTYTFHIQAFEQLGENPDPETDTVLGEADFPAATTNYVNIAAPKDLKATGAYRKITLSWTKSSPKNGGTISYVIKGNNKTYSTSAVTYTIKNLSPRAKSFKFTITAVEKNAKGVVTTIESQPASFATVKTKDFSTQKLTGLVSDPGYKAVLLQWNRMDGATGYKIYWRIGGERGNIDTVGRDSDGHWMKTFRSAKTKKYVVAKKPGKYEYLTTVKNPKSGKKVTFDKRNLKIMNHTYVYFYQFMIIPYYDDDQGDPIFTTAVPENTYKSAALNKTTDAVAGKSNLTYNIVRNNTVLPMYVYESAKFNKPIYKTSSMNDGKKRGRLSKGHKFICWDKANGRVKFYEKKNVSDPSDTYWFAQKNAHTIQGYYMDNCRYGSKTSLKRKDWKTGYSKKTVLDFANHCGLKSKTDYFIWASKYAQHVYILKRNKETKKWELLDNGTNRIPTKTKGCWSNLCSSGKVSIQSRNGNYVIFGKQYKANRKSFDYFYLSKLHKTVRLHSLLYKNGKKFESFKLKNTVLGNPVSKGCIRLRPYAAQWIYKNVPKKTRTVVY